MILHLLYTLHLLLHMPFSLHYLRLNKSKYSFINLVLNHLKNPNLHSGKYIPMNTCFYFISVSLEKNRLYEYIARECTPI